MKIIGIQIKSLLTISYFRLIQFVDRLDRSQKYWCHPQWEWVLNLALYEVTEKNKK